MRPLSIRHRWILGICLVLFCGAAAAIGLFCSSTEPRKTEGSFFEIAGFAPEDVDAVTICFEGTSAELLESDRQRLLASLTDTQGEWITYDHTYPYQISEYPLQFHVGDAVYEFPFAWFNGFEYVISGSGDLARYTSLMQYTDRRVDVQIDGFWFSFQQTGDTFWNEDISEMAYSACVPPEGGILSEACYAGSRYGYVNKTPDYTDPKFYIYESDLIVVAKHVQRDYVLTNPNEPASVYNPVRSEDVFEVTEILKGEWDMTQTISIHQIESLLDDEGGTYLLFLKQYEYAMKPNDLYSPYAQEALAHIYNDTAYACVNHENHAFFEMPLSELRELCRECILYENNVYAEGAASSSDAMADVDSFVISSMQACLSDAGSENYVFSPANLYLQLALLAEATDGDTRAQILSILGSSDTTAIRSRASSLYSTNHLTDSWEHFSLLRNSLWINNTASINSDAMGTLAAGYYTSAYRDDVRSKTFQYFYRDWIPYYTYYLPEEPTLLSDSVFTLRSTVHMNIAWEEPFSLSDFSQESFSTPSEEILCEFMHQTAELDYYRGEDFCAVSKPLTSGGAVQFILPNANTSVEDLLLKEEMLTLMVSGFHTDSAISYEKCMVNLSLPKLILSSHIDVTKPLEAMGITDVFRESSADFSPISSDDTSLSVSQILHMNHILINPNGCVLDPEYLGQLTEMEFTKGEGVDFILDRPFLVLVTGADGMPLLVGVIQEPHYYQTISYH